MLMPIKIKITKKGKRLEDLSKGDILVFPNREEEIRIIDKEMDWLYTQRIRGNVEERIIYEIPSGLINKDSIGRVYLTKKIGEKRWNP